MNSYEDGIRKAIEITEARFKELDRWSQWHLSQRRNSNFEAISCGVCKGEARRILNTLRAEIGLPPVNKV